MFKEGKSSSCVFADAERVYYMNGTVAPLSTILGTVDEVFPYGKHTLVLAAAHTTYLYAPGERRDGYLLGLEDRVPVLAWLRSLLEQGGVSIFAL